MTLSFPIRIWRRSELLMEGNRYLLISMIRLWRSSFWSTTPSSPRNVEVRTKIAARRTRLHPFFYRMRPLLFFCQLFFKLVAGSESISQIGWTTTSQAPNQGVFLCSRSTCNQASPDFLILLNARAMQQIEKS